jgi:hypothetical protein
MISQMDSEEENDTVDQHHRVSLMIMAGCIILYMMDHPAPERRIVCHAFYMLIGVHRNELPS